MLRVAQQGLTPKLSRRFAVAKRRQNGGWSALLGLMRPVVDDPHLENYG